MTTLPPERVNIKRKRDAESVDILLLRSEKRPRFVFQKISPDAEHKFGKPVQADRSQDSAANTGPNGASQPKSANLHQDFTKLDTANGTLVPREFRLNRPEKQNILKHGSTRSLKKKLATFLEVRAAKKDRAESKLPSVSDQPVTASAKNPLLAVPHKRIRPRTSAADIKWREASRTATSSRSASLAPSQTRRGEDDSKDLELAESLAAFAIEATKSPTTPTSTKKNPLKYQPKPPAPRGRSAQKPQNEDVSSANSVESADIDMGDDNIMSESESDYEYDTYVRVPVDTDSMDVDWHANEPKFSGMTHGVLVIEDEDEELWATYALEDEQVPEFDTDEEDEDAEDYYKNEYPEEEVDSEDEYDRGAYGFRDAASDDEHFGNGEDEVDDETQWSDGEAQPRRQGGSQMPQHWIHEFASPVQHGGLNPY